jgi:hypothetical protein
MKQSALGSVQRPDVVMEHSMAHRGTNAPLLAQPRQPPAAPRS